ncbi:MAG: Rid family detoxifying hydrolase [Actinomycetota bacterium]
MSRIGGRTDDAPKPVGPYSQSARIGAVVAAAGQGGFDPVTGELVGDGVAEQTRRALKNVAAVLAANGATLEDVIRTGVFLTDTDDFEAMNEVYRTMFSEPYPARTTYVGLPAGMKIEIDAIAVLAGSSSQA